MGAMGGMNFGANTFGGAAGGFSSGAGGGGFTYGMASAGGSLFGDNNAAKPSFTGEAPPASL